MITHSSKLVIDLGNSETRVMTISGRDSRGKSKNNLTVMDNRYAPVPKEKLGIFLSEEGYNGSNSSLFSLGNDIYYCNGLLCNNEMNETSIKPSALEKKYDALTTKLAIVNAFRQGFIDTAKLAGVSLRDINIDWDLYLLLPPGDLNSGAKKLAELAKSISSISFLIPKLEKPVRIKTVKIFPEGLCAFFGVIFESKEVIRPDYRYLVDPLKSTVIFDIGAGTSDILLAKGGQIVQNSRYSREIGGNNVHRRVQRDLKDRGISLPDGVIRKGVTDGYIMSGSRRIDITNEIESAKSAVSFQLVDSVQEFLESAMISVRTISNILVCGGGAEMSTTNPNIKPISDYIVSYMKRIAPDINTVEMPKVLSNDGNYVSLSPRLLNITGAGILAE